MTHGEAYWCVRRRHASGQIDWLIEKSVTRWQWCIHRDRYPTRALAMSAKWKNVDLYPDCTLSIVRVTHRRKRT